MTSKTCGATTRAGTPCKRIDLYASGRCRLHGGLSTGPSSEAGKDRIRAAQKRRREREKLDGAKQPAMVIEGGGGREDDESSSDLGPASPPSRE